MDIVNDFFLHKRISKQAKNYYRTFLPYHRLNLAISPKYVDYVENALRSARSKFVGTNKLFRRKPLRFADEDDIRSVLYDLETEFQKRLSEPLKIVDEKLMKRSPKRMDLPRKFPKNINSMENEVRKT